MNEQLQGAVAQILERAISGIDSSVEFMQAELPDVIEQLLMWYAVRSALFFIAGVSLLILIPFLWRKWIVKCENSGNYCDGLDLYVIPALLSIIPFFTSILILDIEWLQIWIAPKIWLMEYAAKLVG
ncbi:TMhelix containing protein [Vibrio phage 1.036.O._10N.286.45.C3]|nr:TMhelix containing protein [Vibrio phage 1.036.O._10N.286.45.C3]